MDLIQVTTRDGSFTVPKEIMVKSEFINAFMNKECVDNKLYINISSVIFDRIVEYLTHDTLDINEPYNYDLNELKKYFDMYLLDWSKVNIYKSNGESVLFQKLLSLARSEANRYNSEREEALNEIIEERIHENKDRIESLNLRYYEW